MWFWKQTCHFLTEMRWHFTICSRKIRTRSSRSNFIGLKRLFVQLNQVGQVMVALQYFNGIRLNRLLLGDLNRIGSDNCPLKWWLWRSDSRDLSDKILNDFCAVDFSFQVYEIRVQLSSVRTLVANYPVTTVSLEYAVFCPNFENGICILPDLNFSICILPQLDFFSGKILMFAKLLRAKY